MIRDAIWLGSTIIVASAAFTIVDKAGLIAIDRAGELGNFTAFIGIIVFVGFWLSTSER